MLDSLLLKLEKMALAFVLSDRNKRQILICGLVPLLRLQELLCIFMLQYKLQPLTMLMYVQL